MRNYTGPQSLLRRRSGLIANTFFFFFFLESREAKIKHAETAGVLVPVTVGLIQLHLKRDDGSKHYK